MPAPVACCSSSKRQPFAWRWSVKPLLLLAPTLFAAEIPADKLAFFETKVRPVFAEHCYKCHSTEAGKSKGGLLLDTRAALLKGGDTGASIVAGDPEGSLLIEALRWTNPDVKMPPRKQLTPEQIADLEAWVKMGAPDPRDGTSGKSRIEQLKAAAKSHWAFRPLAKATPSQSIDRFIRARLEATGLKPSAEADPRTLIRRVTLVLTGLPPTPEEVEGADEQSLIATGFCRNGPSNDDNMGKNPMALAQYRADQLDDVISTTASVFLGITLGCARCHDHKTDPFTARDYYSLLAIFNGTEKHGLAKGAKDKDEKDIEDAAKVHALVEKGAHPPPTRVFLRGLAASPGDLVLPAVPAVLTREPMLFREPEEDARTSGRRLALAEWIAAPDNALTWRVLANRVWQHHFGAGLVATPSNFGFNGARPTHPELLDYLASRLIASGGRLKPLHKEILMSATYRQSSQHRADGHERDPQNALAWRVNKQRLSAEALRDSILAVSDKLNTKMGGPGIKPRIRAELLPTSQRNKWPRIETEGPAQWRRSVYIYVKRQLLLPMMELFDAPTTTDSCPQRAQSVVPTQALVLMNDEFVEEQAAHLAQRARGSIARMFELALSRPPSEARLREATDFVEAHTFTDLAHVLLNSSEFLYVE